LKEAFYFEDYFEEEGYRRLLGNEVIWGTWTEGKTMRSWSGSR